MIMLETVLHQEEAVQALRRTLTGESLTPLLLIGPSGLGKRFSTLCAAKSLANGDDAQTYRLDRGIHSDFRVISPEKSTLRVDDVRSALEWTAYRPASLPLKIAVFENIEKASPATANSLLKTLEEPPSYARLFLLSETTAGVLPTILSRCQVVHYRPFPQAFIVEKLLEFTEDTLKAQVCANIAEGSLGQALDILNSGKLSLRDQVWSLLSLAMNKDFIAVHGVIDSICEDLALGLQFLTHALHDIAMYEHQPNLILNFDKAHAASKLSSTLPQSVQVQLRAGLRDIQSRQSTFVNHAFHLKTLIASVFAA